MPKKSYTEFLISQTPQLLDLSKYYESLGLSEAVLWAQDELKGEPTVATAALIHGLRREVLPAEHGEQWLDRLRQKDLNVDEAEILDNAHEALARLEILGVPADLLLRIVRVAQAEVVNNVALLLDQGPQISCVPLPAGREACWQLFDVDTEGHPQSAISGFSWQVRVPSRDADA